MWKIIFVVVLLAAAASSQLFADNELRKFKESKVRIVERVVQSSSSLSFRLPNNSLPLSYDLTLTTDIDRGEFGFSGRVKIHIKILEETQSITLHYKQIEIDAINQLHTDDDSIVIAPNLPYTLIQSHHFVVIALPVAYQADSEIALEILYRGELRDDAAGFYRANYTIAESGDVVWFATTQFEIHDARHAMPCYDEPAIRAPITLTIVHGSNYTAVANMDVESEREMANGYTETRFKPTPSMQTYLLAFLVSDFHSIAANDTRIRQRIYAKPSSIANDEASFAAGVVGPVLQAHEDILGVNYPLDKMDHAAITQFAFGAMENFGLITYVERALLFHPQTPNELVEASKFLIIRIVAHEFAHQYFGNIVSPAWWSYTWLNEGFASLFEVLIPSTLYPEMNFMHRYAFRADGIDAWSMSHYAEHPDELWTKFNSIGYDKSGCVMRMFMEVMTERTFMRGLNLYLRDMYFRAATPHDLHRALQAAYDNEHPSRPLDLAEVMGTWENQAGYPLVSVQIAGDHVIFSQRRYPISNGEIYAVPLTLATKSSRDFEKKTSSQWLRAANAAFTQDSLGFNANDWIVVNIQQVGYYRVDYSTDLWRALIAQLNEDPSVINSLNRAVLQDEIAMAWKDLNRVTAGDVLSMLSYFDREDEPIAWNKAQSTLTTLHNRLFGTDVYESFLEFLKAITEEHLKELGYERDSDELSRISSLRSSTKSWNCIALDSDCLNHELGKLRDYLASPSTGVSFDFCHALRLIDTETFNNLTETVLLQPSLENRNLLLSNFGCSLNEENLKRLLNISISGGDALSEAERSDLLTGTMGRSALALNLTVEFLISNAAIISDSIPSSLGTILSSLAAHINTQTHAARVEALMSELLRSRVIDSALERSVRSDYLANIKWQIENFDDIQMWFSGSGKLALSLGVLAICSLLINIFQ